MGRALAVVLLLGLALGCGSNAAPPDGGVVTGGAGAGGPGTGGTGATGQMCPTSGGTGGLGADGLPTCAVTGRPLDPLNADAAADAMTTLVSGTANDSDDCNRLAEPVVSDAGMSEDCFTQADPWCAPELFAVVDGGVAVDGGTPEQATGGRLIDGDYQLVRYRSDVADGHDTKRSIGVYDGATYVEWASDQKGAAAFGQDQVLRLNTTMSVDGTAHAWNVVTVSCGSLTTTSRYGYSVSGTQLTLYDADTSGVLRNVYTYQRTCSR